MYELQTRFKVGDTVFMDYENRTTVCKGKITSLRGNFIIDETGEVKEVGVRYSIDMEVEGRPDPCSIAADDKLLFSSEKELYESRVNYLQERLAEKVGEIEYRQSIVNDLQLSIRSHKGIIDDIRTGRR